MWRRVWASCASVLLAAFLAAAKPTAHGHRAITTEDLLKPRAFLKGKSQHLQPTTRGLHTFAAAVNTATPTPQSRQAKPAKAAAAPVAKADQQPPKDAPKPAANVSGIPVPEGVEMVAPLEPFEEIDDDIDTAAEFKEDLQKQKMFNTRVTKVKAEEDDGAKLEEEPQHTQFLSHMLNPTGYQHYSLERAASRAMASAVAHIKPHARPGIAPSLAKQKLAAEAEAKDHLSRKDAIASLHRHLEENPVEKLPQQQISPKAKRVAAKERKQQAHDRLSKVLNATELANSTDALPAEVVEKLSGAVHKPPAAKWNHSGDPIASLHSHFEKDEEKQPVQMRIVKKVAPTPQKPKFLRDVMNTPIGEIKEELKGLEQDHQAPQAASSHAASPVHHQGDVIKSLHEHAKQAKQGKQASETKPPLPKTQVHTPKAAKVVPASKKLGSEVASLGNDVLAGAIPEEVAKQLVKAEAALAPKVNKAAALPHKNVSGAINAIHKKVHVEPPSPAAPKADDPAAVPKVEQEQDELGFHHARATHTAEKKRAKGDVDEALRRAAAALKDPSEGKQAQVEAKKPRKDGHRIDALHQKLEAHDAPHASSAADSDDVLPLKAPKKAPKQAVIPGLHRHVRK